jgi:Icc protein
MATLRIAHLSDLHLTRDLSHPRWRTLERILCGLPQLVGYVDRVILSGDIANTRFESIYPPLRELLTPWWDKLRLIPGNHDHRDQIQRVFGERLTAVGNKSAFSEDLAGVRLIGLDTARPFRVSGRIGALQLSWLGDQLDAGLPTLIFLHHPPLAVGAWWLGKDLLRDRRALAKVVQGKSVRAILCGHVHQPFEGTFHGIPLFTTPSTAYQFHPTSLIPRTTGAPPAFRVIEMEAGAITATAVHQLLAPVATPRS